MIGKLFLSGGGGAEDSLQVDKLFVQSIPNGSKILYIPHANIKQSADFSKSIEWLSGTLSAADSEVNINIECFNDLDLIKELDDYAAIYIGGGNTYHLMGLLRSFGLDKKLKKYYESGGIIYGGSAGAIILGRYISTAPEQKINIDNDYSGLNLLGGMSVVCHFEKGLEIPYTESSKMTILCLFENSAIMVEDNAICNVGPRDYKIQLSNF